MEKEYYAGFMQPKPGWLDALGLLRIRAFVFLGDLIVLFYLFVMASYCFSRAAYGHGSYLLVPWWILVVVVVELTVAWESFSISLSMKLAGLCLLSRDGKKVPFTNRVVRYFAWHASALPAIGILALLWDRERLTWHDRLSATTMERPAEPSVIKDVWYRTGWGIVVASSLSVTLLAGIFITKIDLRALFTGAPKTVVVWRGLVTPDWSLLGEGIGLLVVTIFMALMATLFAIVVAVPLSFLAARNLTRGFIGRVVYTVIRVTMSITRSIEPIVWAIIFVVWVRVGAFPGVLALFVHSIADLTKLYSERLESIDPGPVEAVTATGANRLQVITHGIIPQIVNPYLSFTLYRWDINVRMATVIGIVGGGGIGQMLYQYTRLWRWQAAGTMMLLIIVAVWAIDYLSSRLRARLE